jgi:hypothetical protein
MPGPAAFDQVAVSTRPTRGGAWHLVQLGSDADINAVACPTTGLCVVGDSAGNIETASSPAGPARAWRSQSVDPGGAIDALSCPRARLCVAGDGTGRVLIGTR